MPSKKSEPAYFTPADLRIMKHAFQTLQQGQETAGTEESKLKMAKMVVYAYRTNAPESVLNEAAKLLLE